MTLTVGPFASSCVQPDTTIDRVFDPCEPMAIVLDDAGYVAQAEAGIALWNDTTGARLALGDDVGGAGEGEPRLEVRFVDAPSGQFGVYDDERGTIFINRRLTDASEMSITIAHELGHAMGLLHVDATERRSVMNPANTETPPRPEDRDALVAIWGTCSSE